MFNIFGGEISVFARILKLGAKIANCKILGHPILHGRPQYTQITTIKIYLLIELRYYFHVYVIGFILGFEKFNYVCK